MYPISPAAPLIYVHILYSGPETKFFWVFGPDVINTPLQRAGGCAGRHQTVSTVSHVAFLRSAAYTTLNVSSFLLSIAGQEEHHRRRSYADELRLFVQRYGLSWREDETVETVSMEKPAPAPR
jgi:hypothetical protein